MNRNHALIKLLSQITLALGVSEHVYVVGGAVRNTVLRTPIKDIDIVADTVRMGHDTEWLAQAIAKALRTDVSIATNQYGVAIMTIRGALTVDGFDLTGEKIEIAAARTESYGGESGKGYKPDTVDPSTIEDDVRRREFSFNTLLWRMHDLADGPDKAPILDLTGCGLRDLQEGMMRCPSDPDVTFSDDPSRLIRLIRFAVKYGFKVPPETRAAAMRQAPRLANVPHHALSKLLIEVMAEETGKKALAMMEDLGFMEPIRGMVQRIPAFRETLANWSNQLSVQYLFDLMDLGLVQRSKVTFLTAPQQERLREVATTMDRDTAEVYVDILRQPGKLIDMESLAALKPDMGPKAFALVQQEARRHLLAQPRYMRDRGMLMLAVRNSIL